MRSIPSQFGIRLRGVWHKLRHLGGVVSRERSFLLAGQSNIGMWVHGDDPAGRDSFVRTLAALCPDSDPAVLYSVARGGSCLFAQSTRESARQHEDDPVLHREMLENYWIDPDSGDRGDAFRIAAERIASWRSRGVRFEAILWSQGEGDARFVDERTAVQYRHALRTVLDALRRCARCRTVFIQELGSVADAGPDMQVGIDHIREAQHALAAEDPDIVIATTTRDLPLRDQVHLTDEGYRIAAERMARFIATRGRPSRSD